MMSLPAPGLTTKKTKLKLNIGSLSPSNDINRMPNDVNASGVPIY